ncbi:MAG: glycosyltransferase, partial [Armatimonadetes bacterium]|nr:glycosyltransferase [Armatimonadota bacterium]
MAGQRSGVGQHDKRDDPLVQASEARRLEYSPLISVLIPVYNTAPQYLRQAVDSVLAQVYSNWELILYDDGSTHAETLAALEEITPLDSRIRVRYSSVNRGIATTTNAALAEAQGEYVAMLDHDDELLPDALFEVVKTLNSEPTLDAIYTDQCQIEPDGTMVQAFHKPDWSLQMLRGVMYVGHLLVIRRVLADTLSGFDPAFDNVQDFEFMLRLAEKTERIGHVPKILYRWRRILGSVALDGDEKKDIERLQAAAVNAHLARCGIEASAQANPRHAHRLLLIPRPRVSRPLVSVVVHASGVEGYLRQSCEQICMIGAYPSREVIVVGGSIPSDVEAHLRHIGILFEAPGKRGGEAFLAGLERARGEIVVSMHGD